MNAIMDDNVTVIPVPAYLTMWDLEKTLATVMRTLTKPGEPCMLDMKRVHFVYSATIRLILRVYERASRMGSIVLMINTSQTAYNALKALQIDQKIPILPDRSDYVERDDESVFAA